MSSDPFAAGADVYFSGPPIDWRQELAEEVDPDDEEIETPPDVVAMLGFDPRDLANSAEQGKVGA